MAKILVIGDVMLDKYNFCKNRENPESSAPCYTVERVEYKPGGAGNVAANLASLGTETTLVGVIGDDSEGKILQDSLKKLNVNVSLIVDSLRHTIVKERALSLRDGRYHFRLDHETKDQIPENHVRDIVSLATGYDLILISDYNKGLISMKLLDELKKLNIPIFVDPKPEHLGFYSGVFLIKPNSLEARAMTGSQDDLTASNQLARTLSANILLTRGENGIAFFGRDGERFYFSSQANEVVDVTGAGGTAIATFAHFYLKGKMFQECTKLANAAAGISVAHPGCYLVTEEEVRRALE